MIVWRFCYDSFTWGKGKEWCWKIAIPVVFFGNYIEMLFVFCWNRTLGFWRSPMIIQWLPSRSLTARPWKWWERKTAFLSFWVSVYFQVLAVNLRGCISVANATRRQTKLCLKNAHLHQRPGWKATNPPVGHSKWWVETGKGRSSPKWPKHWGQVFIMINCPEISPTWSSLSRFWWVFPWVFPWWQR